ncbi:MAG: zinc ABC transporter substrate-binding protein [Chloroflexota bacterium]|nr:zinc ABC transporter substrate-binding protein [Chloroflexota bacterium]
MTRIPPSTTNRVQISSRWRPLLALLAVPILSGCGRLSQGQELPDLGDRVIRVTATTGQVADLARQVGGERVSVDGLMGPGVDPHLFKASERNVEELIDSDAIFFNGLHLEGKLGELLERLSDRRPVFSVGDAIPADLLTSPPEFEGNPDPHVWFDPTMWAYTCRFMGEALTSIDPSHSQTYAAAVAAYAQELDQIDCYAMEQFSSIPDQQRVLVTAHDAFGYLGRRYDLEVVGLQGISTSTEAGIRDVQRIADLLVERRVPSIFVETSVPRRTIEAVQVATADRGWQVTIGGELFSDALGDSDTPEGTYLGMFRHNVATIVAGLTGLKGDDAE